MDLFWDFKAYFPSLDYKIIEVLLCVIHRIEKLETHTRTIERKIFHNSKCDVSHQMICFFFRLFLLLPYGFKHKLMVWFCSVFFFFFDFSTNSSLISVPLIFYDTFCVRYSKVKCKMPHKELISSAKAKRKTIEFLLLFLLRCNYSFMSVYNNMWPVW